ncbi:uncharacterized protein LOC106654730 [Trichogramma pretiosum]|uniref:uncharacterized protein LOC106654730 n=1 Tax=Trichogramma pretiosum TaxID=7493 RepID=UPI0006C993A6|nr:uncharacterized protein LOC106654730 [Trichogramma pretiosum]
MSLIRKLTLAYLLLHLTTSLTAHQCDHSYLKCEDIPTSPSGTSRLCGAEHIPKRVNYTALTSIGSNGTEAGVLRVRFDTHPEAGCRYRVVLMVDDRISDDAECDRHVFKRKRVSQTFSRELTICPREEALDTGEYNYMIDHNFPPSGQSCNSTDYEGYKLDLLFRNAFTGCYGLGFITDSGEMIVPTRQIVETDYVMTTIGKIQGQCRIERNPNYSARTKQGKFPVSIKVEVSKIPKTYAAMKIKVISDKSHKYLVDHEYQLKPYGKTQYVEIPPQISYNEHSSTCKLNLNDIYVSSSVPAGVNVLCHYDEWSFEPNQKHKLVVQIEDDRCSDGLLWHSGRQRGQEKRCVFETNCALVGDFSTPPKPWTKNLLSNLYKFFIQGKTEEVFSEIKSSTGLQSGSLAENIVFEFLKNIRIYAILIVPGLIYIQYAKWLARYLGMEGEVFDRNLF